MQREKIILYVLQGIILIFAFGYFTGVTFFEMSPAGNEHSKTIVGFLLGTVVGTIISYNWGSSKSSADKTEAANKAEDCKK